MSELSAARDRILGALEAGGVRVASTGKLAPPVVLVEPGDPWSTPRRAPGRTSRWRLTAIAGAADKLAAYDELGELVDLVDAALRKLDGAELPTWARPVNQSAAGERAAFAAVATIQYASS